MTKYLIFTLFIFVNVNVYGQWKGVWGIGVSKSNYKCSEPININNKLLGGNIYLNIQTSTKV